MRSFYFCEKKMVGNVALNEEMDNKKRSFTNGPCEAKNAKDKEIISPPAKKLKQARLPFKPVNSPSLTNFQSPTVTKKVKVSDTPSPFTSSHGKARKSDKKTTPGKKADTPVSKKTSMKGKKIGFAVESKPKSSKSNQGPCFTKETEVSSSSGDVKSSEKECDSTADAKKTHKAAASLDCFLQTTQQPLVSTSDIIDLISDDEEGKNVGDKEQDEPNSSGCHVDSESGKPEDEETPAVNTSMVSISSASSLEQMSSDEESSDDDEEEEEEDADDESEDKDKPEGMEEDGEQSSSIVSPSSTQDGLKKTLLSTPVNAKKPLKQKSLSAKARVRVGDEEKKKADKQKQREDRKRKLEEEKEEKKRMKLEGKQAREEEKEALRKQKMEEKKQRQMERQKEKDAKKEQEEQERLEKKKMKEEERLKKEEERLKKQQENDAKHGDRKKKLEEKQKQEEEKKQKETEALMKKEKQAQMFKSFFKVQAPAPVKKPEVKGRFAPFQVKEDMVLAPCVRIDREKLDRDGLDHHLVSQSCSSLYVDQLKRGASKPGKSASTPGPVRPAKDGMDVDQQPEETHSRKKPKLMRPPEGVKMKLIQFHENYRPAYWGSWKRETAAISGRKPFIKDEDAFDYEFDSDDEWEEPGESLSHSEGEDEDSEKSDGDDEDEDGFFVPHGYLSAGEGGEDDDDADGLKARQAAKAKAWENELRRRCEALKPIIVTFIQVASSNKTRQEEMKKKLEAYRAVPLTVVPIATSHTKAEKKTSGEEGGQSEEGQGVQQPRFGGSVGNKLKPVPEEAMPDLLSLVHGNTGGIKSLIREFRDHWRRKQHASRGTTPIPGAKSSPSSGLESPAPIGSPVPEVMGASPTPLSTPSPHSLDHVEHVISKRQLDLKINSIAVREKRSDFKRICWYVHPHVLERYKMKYLPIPTSWVNGIGVRDVNSSPLPPTNMAPVPPVATAYRPPVNKPVIIVKPQTQSANTVLSLLAAQRQSVPMGSQPVFLPSSSTASAFNKVGSVRIPGMTTGVSVAPVQPLAYMTTGGSILQPGLAPVSLMPLAMQHAINPTLAGVGVINPGINIMNPNINASTLLQQAAATSYLASLTPTQSLHQVQRNVSGGAVQPGNITLITKQNGVPKMTSPPSVGKPKSAAVAFPVATTTPPKPAPSVVQSSPSGTSGPSLPSLKQGSPKSLDAAIAKLYQSSSLPTSPSAQEKPKPTQAKKTTTTLTKFFNVKTSKPSSENEKAAPAEAPKVSKE